MMSNLESNLPYAVHFLCGLSWAAHLELLAPDAVALTGVCRQLQAVRIAELKLELERLQR